MENRLLIGTSEYLAALRHQRLSAHEQLALILDRQLQSYVDDNGFLQLAPAGYAFASTLAPLSFFYVYFRDLVVAAYHTPAGLRTDSLGRRIHLFRSYLDRQAITFIRRYQSPQLSSAATDLQRLVQYVSDHRSHLDFQTSAGFHNRYHGKYNYPQNMKVQLIRNSHALTKNRARMIEFIINIDSGSFVSQWNVYRQNSNGLVDTDPRHYSVAELYHVANTESFNYGIPYGGRIVLGKYRHTHQWLDITQPQNSRIRRVAKNYWHFPHDYRQGGPYADVIKSFNDVFAWRKIPLALRQQVYDDFTQTLGRRKNKGINHFLKHSEYRQFFVKNFENGNYQ